MKWILLYVVVTSNNPVSDNGWMLLNTEQECAVMAEKLKTERHAIFAECGPLLAGGPTL